MPLPLPLDRGVLLVAAVTGVDVDLEDDLLLRADLGFDEVELALAAAVLEVLADAQFPLEHLLAELLTVADLKHLYRTRLAHRR